MVINHRYERGSPRITSNKSIREWPEMLAGDEVLATAILDRLLHSGHVLQIDGRSFRLKAPFVAAGAPHRAALPVPVPGATPHLRREEDRSSTADPDHPECANLRVP